MKSEGSSDEEWPSVENLPPAQLNLFRLFSSGITELVWSQNPNIQGLDISEDCKASLLTVLQHINEGSEWAYKGKNIIIIYQYILMIQYHFQSVLDASSKSPSGILNGTLTSFGDFDQCIYLRTREDVFPSFAGKYCSIEFSVETEGNHFAGNITNIIRSRIPAFGSHDLQLGLCLPSLCEDKDIDTFVKSSKLRKCITWTWNSMIQWCYFC